jgi:hypothetical protein
MRACSASPSGMAFIVVMSHDSCRAEQDRIGAGGFGYCSGKALHLSGTAQHPGSTSPNQRLVEPAGLACMSSVTRTNRSSQRIALSDGWSDSIHHQQRHPSPAATRHELLASRPTLLPALRSSSHPGRRDGPADSSTAPVGTPRLNSPAAEQ